MTRFFPIVMIILQVCASAVYFWFGDIWHGIYWTGAVIVTAAVTFGF